jgi:hypothetical protein
MATLDEIAARLQQPALAAGEANRLPTFTGPLQEEKSMPTLTDEIKEFIVKGLACFDTPSQVAEAVKVNFGIEVSRQQVYVYDPAGSQPPALRWREIHAATRTKFLRDVAEIGVSHKVVRLRVLDRLVHRCERNSVALAIDCLEQAAKECGGIYENRRPVVLQLPMPQPSVSQPALSPNGCDALIESIRVRQLPDLTVPPAS